MPTIAENARKLSLRINWFVERFCVFLLLILVLDVWLGVLVRYVIPLPLTFTEELARYLMIWMALLAVSSAIVYREHIGVAFILGRLPLGLRRVMILAFDLIGVAFFAALFWYGIGFAEKGFGRMTMIYAMPKGYPFMGVPLAAFLAALQLALSAFIDWTDSRPPKTVGPATLGGGPV